ncbi:hypothetical protein ACFVS2_20485 [Brevibacillus sp. NPDC058079]|uniref:hypothetical protein n=1 Tax=Brevibacillus sp. NPDC058079 TaxID=3346330 RepID=UPI0036DFBDF3
MLKDIQGAEDVVTYMKELLDKPNGKYQLARICGMAHMYEEQQEKENQIEEILNLSRRERAVETTLLGDSMAIVQVEKRTENGVVTYFHPVVNGKRSFEVAETLDHAVVIALGQKYGVGQYAPQAIRAILQMDQFEEKFRPKTFIEKCVSGEETVDRIDDYVEVWHTAGDEVKLELPEYLGISDDDYEKYLKDSNYIYQIVVSAIQKQK